MLPKLTQAMSACPPFIKFLYQLLSLNAELLSSDAALYSIDHAADESGATLVFQLAHLLSCTASPSRFRPKLRNVYFSCTVLAYPSQAAQDRPLRLTSIVNTEHMVSMVNGEQQVRCVLPLSQAPSLHTPSAGCS